MDGAQRPGTRPAGRRWAALGEVLEQRLPRTPTTTSSLTATKLSVALDVQTYNGPGKLSHSLTPSASDVHDSGLRRVGGRNAPVAESRRAFVPRLLH